MVTLLVVVRNIEQMGDITAIGCQYVPRGAADHRLIADLVFANSDQWTKFQQARRRNPGIIRGTFWFLSMSLYQTSRGLIYLFRGVGSDRTQQRQDAKARS